jgi:diketogulonate reductase-like aldo/keto reductase
LDLCLIHWPVPGHFVDAYRVLEELHRQGKIRAIGLSNFAPRDYEELVSSGITVPPSVNQIEASVVMYRKDHIDFFQGKNIVVYAHKTLNRASCLDRPEIANLASKYKVTGAQIMIRWGFQKDLAMAVKTNNLSRMRENREISHFSITEEDMESLDSLTTPEDITARVELEDLRKR